MTKPLFEVFRDVRLGNPRGSQKEHRDEFIARMKSDPGYLELLALAYFERFVAVWEIRSAVAGSYSFGRTEISQDKIERMVRTRPEPKTAEPKTVEMVRRTREEAAARTAMAFEALKSKVRSVILLDLIMPNGKALRDATGAECAKAGGFYAAVAKSIKPTQVVDRHLTEGDLQNIRARFYQINKTEVA